MRDVCGALLEASLLGVGVTKVPCNSNYNLNKAN